MNKPKLNCHVIVENVDRRRKLSWFVPLDTLYSMHTRKTIPNSVTRENLAIWLIETKLKTDLPKPQLEAWLVDLAETQ